MFGTFGYSLLRSYFFTIEEKMQKFSMYKDYSWGYQQVCKL